MTTKSLITGITGQDGSYLAELLLDKGHEVYGIVRRASTISTDRIDHLLFPDEQITLEYGDLHDGLDNFIHDIKPDCIFNLGSMSHVKVSFDIPAYTMDVNAVGTIKILEAIRRCNLKNTTRFYQASSSEMFGMSPPPQDENTPFYPCSPYGVSKVAGYWITKLYREGYNMFASNGILFNHESERRGETFVTKKVVRGAVRICLGKQKELVLGNLSAKRDWGHSKDYMDAIYKMMTHNVPDDFVVATGAYYSIEEFVIKVFEKLMLDWKDYVRFDAKYTRPREVPALMGNPSKIKNTLGWEPKIDLDELITLMIDHVMDEER